MARPEDHAWGSTFSRLRQYYTVYSDVEGKASLCCFECWARVSYENGAVTPSFLHHEGAVCRADTANECWRRRDEYSPRWTSRQYHETQGTASDSRPDLLLSTLLQSSYFNRRDDCHHAFRKPYLRVKECALFRADERVSAS